MSVAYYRVHTNCCSLNLFIMNAVASHCIPLCFRAPARFGCILILDPCHLAGGRKKTLSPKPPRRALTINQLIDYPGAFAEPSSSRVALPIPFLERLHLGLTTLV